MDKGVAMSQPLIYTGTIQPTPEEQKEKQLYPYLPDDELRDAVNLAIYLERPLLLKGEPGSGKTRLAHAVAYEFSQKYCEDGEAWPFYFWPIKSTSRALDGLYTYDAVEHLRDAQLKKEKKVQKYIRFGKLGDAFRQEKYRPIVLIDEIDKADIDFPNDLLIEIEDPSFEVQQTGEKITAAHKPIIFITSNDEKDLPDAFLRRCLFHYIEFPERAQLERIIAHRFPDHNPALAKKAVSQFLALRAEMSADKQAGKKVSTSELLDWIQALHRNLAPDEAPGEAAPLDAREREALLAQFEAADPAQKLMLDQVLALLENGRLPFLGVLLKSWEDYRAYLGRLHKEQEEQEAQAANEAESEAAA
jgi:MoxR-like ATPase